MVPEIGVNIGDEAVVDWVRAVELVCYLLNLQSGANLRDEHNVLADVAGAGEPLDDLPRVLVP